MEIHENIKSLREKQGLSQSKLAEMTGYKDRSSIAKVEAGLVDLTQSKIAAFAKALHVTPGTLMGIEDSDLPAGIFPLPQTVKRPRLGVIACGEPIMTEENFDGYDDVPVFIKCNFTLRCEGDSMINARILDGDIVYIRQQPDVDNGEIAAVYIDGAMTLKRIYKYPNQLVLQPENPKYAPLVYSGQELENIRIIGKVVGFTSEKI